MEEHCQIHCRAVTDSVDKMLAIGLPNLSAFHNRQSRRSHSRQNKGSNAHLHVG